MELHVSSYFVHFDDHFGWVLASSVGKAKRSILGATFSCVAQKTEGPLVHHLFGSAEFHCRVLMFYLLLLGSDGCL